MLSPTGLGLPVICGEGGFGRTGLRPGTAITREEKRRDPFLIPKGGFAHPCASHRSLFPHPEGLPEDLTSALPAGGVLSSLSFSFQMHSLLPSGLNSGCFWVEVILDTFSPARGPKPCTSNMIHISEFFSSPSFHVQLLLPPPHVVLSIVPPPFASEPLLLSFRSLLSVLQFQLKHMEQTAAFRQSNHQQGKV